MGRQVCSSQEESGTYRWYTISVLFLFEEKPEKGYRTKDLGKSRRRKKWEEKHEEWHEKPLSFLQIPYEYSVNLSSNLRPF